MLSDLLRIIFMPWNGEASVSNPYPFAVLQKVFSRKNLLYCFLSLLFTFFDSPGKIDCVTSSVIFSLPGAVSIILVVF